MADTPIPENDWPDAAGVERAQALVLDLDGFAGPIDLLLTLARDQKVDLTRISILALAEQYLAFVAEARRIRLELAADYLVMAAWLAYLKSRLLLPAEAVGEEPTGAEMAAALQFQLQRLEAMRNAAEKLMARPRLGRDVFPRGAPEGLRVVTLGVLDVSLFELLAAYATIQRRGKAAPLTIGSTALYSVDQAIHRLTRMLGELPEWTTLDSLLPHDIHDPLLRRSALASTFVASLELAKTGELEVRQDGAFGDIYLRPARRQGEG